MEHDGNRTAGVSADTKPRVISSLTIIGSSQRKSLFSRPRAKDEPTRPTSTGALPDTTHGASLNGDTKIAYISQQRPFQPRRPFTITDAYRRAEEEEEAAAQGSPSPAPRAWRSRRESSERSTSRPRDLARKSTDSTREDTAGSGMSIGGQSQQGNISDASFDEKMRQHALSQGTSEEPNRRSSGLFSKGLGSKIVETGRGLVRHNSRASLGGTSSSPRASRYTPSSLRIGRLLSSNKKRQSANASTTNDPADWVRVDPEGQSQPSTAPSSRPTTAPSGHLSPEKSFAWDAEEDFTAGDLQVSNSPPLNIGRTNTKKIDEIRALEAELDEPFTGNSQTRSRNRLLDEICALEAAARVPLPDDPHDSDLLRDGKHLEATESRESLQGGDRKAGVGMDDRTREIERLARRALATARLDEIRERNPERTSRSPSPDIARKPSNEPLRVSLLPGNRQQRRQSIGAAAVLQRREDMHSQEISEKPSRDESRHLLHRLSVTAGANPLSNPPIRSIDEALSTRDGDREQSDTSRRRRIGSARSDGRPTVGFIGIRRSDSVESGLSKKSGGLQSEPDPTERIEGEMNLFAPLENHSERGSLRALSPDLEEESEGEEENHPIETPKVSKPDPLTQPTPRITGAFVETPATVKAERPQELGDVIGTEESKPQVPDQGLGRSDSKSSLRGRRGSAPSRQTKQSQSVRDERSSSRAASLSARRRARSLSRSRLLTNSSKPPTVQDDLLEIQRANQIEDSTLEDIADLLVQKGPEGQGLVDENDIKSDVQDELDRYERMSRSIKSGLLGIQSAKQGIQRLEDKFAAGLKSSANESTKEETAGESSKGYRKDATRASLKKESTPNAENGRHSGAYHSHEKTAAECPMCYNHGPAANGGVTYLHLPFPRLWYTKPKFRLTFLGLVLVLITAWYIAESAMCYLYCKPMYCYPGKACEWSIDDPLWGYTLPVKLDQWSTGGRGRELVRRLGPEVSDWIVDLWDGATGRDIMDVDTSHYSWWRRHQHSRRLYKKNLR